MFRAIKITFNSYLFFSLSSSSFSSLVVLFKQHLAAGWWRDYSLSCQPVDYSDSYQSRRVSEFLIHCLDVFTVCCFFLIPCINLHDSVCLNIHSQAIRISLSRLTDSFPHICILCT